MNAVTEREDRKALLDARRTVKSAGDMLAAARTKSEPADSAAGIHAALAAIGQIDIVGLAAIADRVSPATPDHQDTKPTKGAEDGDEGNDQKADRDPPLP